MEEGKLARMTEHLESIAKEVDLERIIEADKDLFCVAGSDGFFRKLNASWERTLGWTREELCSKPWLSFVHPDDVEATIRAAEEMRSGPVQSFRNRYRTKGGEYRLLEWWALAWRDDGLAFAVARIVA